jgi:hypothetical protein
MKTRAHLEVGLRAVVCGGLLLLAATLAGCGGHDGVSNGLPTQAVALENVNDDIGTIEITPHGPGGLPAPGAVAELIAANTVQIRWSPQAALWALVKVNGRELDVVPAADGLYLDAGAKAPGIYRYELCFCKSGKSGPVAAFTVTITDHVAPDGVGSPGNGRMTDGSS